MSTQAERATAISHASEALGDPADFFETHTVKGKPATAPGIAGAFGRTVEAEQEERTRQVFARDLITVADFIVSAAEHAGNAAEHTELGEDEEFGPVDPVKLKREAVREVLHDMTRDPDYGLEIHVPENGTQAHDWVKGYLDLDMIIQAVEDAK